MMLLTKENFLKEAEKFILNYNNTFNNDYKKQDVDSGILERFIFDHQEDEDVRKFLVRAIKQGLSLIDTLVDFIQKENNFKNDKTLSFLILYIYQVEPYYSQLRGLVDYTGYSGGFKDLKILLDLLNKMNTLYKENIEYDGTKIKILVDYIKSLSVDDRRNLYARRQEKPPIDKEIQNFINAYYNNNYDNEPRYKEIYNELYYGQKVVNDINNESYNKYISIIVGNIGEQIVFAELNKKYSVCYCSRDVGDYVGYDLYYIDPELNKEKLIEAKATKKYKYDKGEDIFKIGVTELPKIQSTLSDPNVEYEVKRVFLEISENGNIEYKITTLKPISSNQLMDEDGNVYNLLIKGKDLIFKCDMLTRKNKLVRN